MLTREDDVDAHVLDRRGLDDLCDRPEPGHDGKTSRVYLYGGRGRRAATAQQFGRVRPVR
jgi:hypothetical protein